MKLLATIPMFFFGKGVQGVISQSVKLILILTLFNFIFSFSSFSQSNNKVGWDLVKSQDGIEVYSQIVSCETDGSEVPFDYLVFKAVNTSSSQKTALLHFEIHFEEGCNGCERNEENSLELMLESGESVSASCSTLENKLSYIILNPSFQGSWKYEHSEVFIQLIK